MKHWLGLAALICFGSTAAMAYDETYDINCSSITSLSTGATSSYAPVFAASLQGAVTVYQNIMPNRKWIELDNLDTTRYVMVAFGINPSTTPANWLAYTDTSGISTSRGHLIAPASYWRVGLTNYDTRGYPIIPVILNATGASGTAAVSVTQCGAP